MEAYCVKCKTKREMQEAKADFNSKGAPVSSGVCPVCGTKLFRFGRTEAHEGLQPRIVENNIKRKGKLVIVESPAKARTVGHFLGKDYSVIASVGHVRDLLKSELSVDVNNHFTPKYRVPNEKRQVVKEIKDLVKRVERIYLATDPDREGEAIAWHLTEAALIDPDISQRVVFHEITQSAINEAFSNPRDIDMNLVNAQQARRILDRLVGYSISPILWNKVRGRLSAGRVQSVALRLIIDREREIRSFNSVEYWTIQAELRPKGKRSSFLARLHHIDGEEPALENEQVVNAIVDDLETANFLISKIKRGERRRKPLPPYITSTLQQEASRKLGFTAKRIMRIAQTLYEGIDVEKSGGTTGLITYMRTDSTNVAEIAQQEAKEFILKNYGESFIPPTPPQYKTKVASAQEAHEAIRPTSVFRTPELMKQYLTSEQFKLYQLIWRRFVASQMEAAIFDTLSVDVEGTSKLHRYDLRTSGSTVRFSGFLVVYEEAVDEDQVVDENENAIIPTGLEEGQVQDLKRLLPEQHFTQPPPRFTEASLIQKLEEFGIGRPSTYASILSIVQERGYIEKEAKRLLPTEIGFLVNDLLIEYFPEIEDVHFTAHMEEDLDRIAEGEKEWIDIISEFYSEFEPRVARAKAEMPETKAEPERIGRLCPKCGQDLVIRYGRYGKFISCSAFPNCRHAEPWLVKLGVKCPEDGAEIVIRKTRKGRIFYGCENFPTCQFTSWKRPISIPCPKCGGLLVISNKKEADCIKCETAFLLEEIGEIPEMV